MAYKKGDKPQRSASKHVSENGAKMAAILFFIGNSIETKITSRKLEMNKQKIMKRRIKNRKERLRWRERKMCKFRWWINMRVGDQYEGGGPIWGWDINMRMGHQYEGGGLIWGWGTNMRAGHQYEGGGSVWGWRINMRVGESIDQILGSGPGWELFSSYS